MGDTSPDSGTPDTDAPDTDADALPTGLRPCARGYADADGDGYPSRRCAKDGEPGVPRLHGVDCDDTDPDVHPDATERCGDATDDDCDGEALPCAWGPSSSMEDASLYVAGDSDGTFLGDTISRVGWSGAGTAVAVGSWWRNNIWDSSREYACQGADGVHGVGGLWVFEGLADDRSPLSLSDATATLVPGDGECVFRAATGVGDVTGDGVADILVQEETREHDMYFALFEGPLVGPVGFSDYRAKVYVRGTPGAAGDWNGDGVGDLTAPPYEGGSNQIAVWTAPFGLELHADDAVLVIGPTTTSDPLRAIGASDFDGDGLPDLAMEGFLYDREPFEAGTVAIIPNDAQTGAPFEELAVALINGTGKNEWLGRTLAAPGDLNADGYPDLIATSNFQGAKQPYGGYVLFGPWSGESSALDHSAAFVNSNPTFDGPGDFDGDGVDDLALGGFWDVAPTGQDAGAIELFPGPLAEGTYDLTSARGLILWAPDGTAVGAATPVGDLDGDGRADLAVAADDNDPIPGAGGVYFVFGGAL